ncbi:MAG TPA: acetylglutamate kinase [Acidimicrobiia bacterium]|nr:acetylglutamate kinase [Acidimicrobiia bacterium]
MSLGHGAPDVQKSRIANSMGRARILMEALPYIKAFRGTTVVIKYGGSAMDDPELRESFAGDVTLLSMVGIRPVVVHGGGPQISAAMAAEGIEPTWVDGLRVTDLATIGVVQRTLVGVINPEIVRFLNGHGATAVGVTGLDADLFRAEPRDERLGFVGNITTVNSSLITGIVDAGLVPVVAPIARGDDGNVYNVNADTAAGVLARALRAQKLVYLTDVEGVYGDHRDPTSLISRMRVSELRDLLPSISGGMLPKLSSVLEALEGGVSQAHILDGRTEHALLLEVFTSEGIGTMVVP